MACEMKKNLRLWVDSEHLDLLWKICAVPPQGPGPYTALLRLTS